MDQEPNLPLLRSIDASLNRAGEGLRVVEDYVRFGQDDHLLTQTAKQIRHELAAIANNFSFSDRLSARDTESDVGTKITTSAEMARADLDNVCHANLHRVQESLRSLEEFSKTIEPKLAARFESLRYQTYTLAKLIGTQQRSNERLLGANLYVLLPACESLEAFKQLVTTLCEAGADVVQLRAKHLSDRELVQRAQAMVSIAKQNEVLSIVNDRPDIALIAGADGVHVGQDELSVKQARKVLGTNKLVGVSTHNLDQLRQAVASGADYLGLGPTFPSQTKCFDTFAGLEYLALAAKETKLPSFAIGGIGLDNLDQVLATNTSRVAVSSAICKSSNPTELVQQFKANLKIK